MVELDEILACPKCKGPVNKQDDAYVCPACRLRFSIRDGIPDFLLEDAEPWQPPEAPEASQDS